MLYVPAYRRIFCSYRLGPVYMTFRIICEAALNSSHFSKLELNKPPLSTLYFVDHRDRNILHYYVYLINVVGFGGERSTKIGNTFYLELLSFLHSQNFANTFSQQNTSLAVKGKWRILFLVEQKRLYKSVQTILQYQ